METNIRVHSMKFAQIRAFKNMALEHQKELFKEFKKEKGKFEKIAEKISQRQPKFYVYLPLENIVFAAIVVIMCVIVAFALGMERGKRFATISDEHPQRSLSSVSKKALPGHSPGEAITLEGKKLRTEQRDALRIQAKTKETEKAAGERKFVSAEKKAQETSKLYAIQLISYERKQRALKEKNKLLNKKIDAFMIPSGKWYQVCAGRYANIEEAKIALKRFSKDYKDCFIRKVSKGKETRNR